MRFHLIAITIIATFSVSFCQTPSLYDSTNTSISNKAIYLSQYGVGIWKCDSLKIGELINNHYSDIGLSAFDSFELVSITYDSFIGITNYKYHQFYKGYEVQDADYVEHVIDSNVVVTTGIFCENLDKIPTINYSESQALDSALQFLSGHNFAWDNDTLEHYLKLDSFASDTTYFPRGSILWVFDDDTLFTQNHFELAYHFAINVVNSDTTQITELDVYVSTNSGQIIKVDSSIQHADFTHDIYGSMTTLDTRLLNGKYYLQADNYGRDIRTKGNNFLAWNTKDLPSDNDNTWNGPDQGWITSVHWSAQEAWAYWKFNHNLNGANGNGKPLRVKTLAGEGAYYDRVLYQDYISIKGLNDHIPISSLEIIGHEYAHVVAHYHSNIKTKKEWGAVAESYSDIFGILTERSVFGFQNWTLGDRGDDSWSRDLSNPRSKSVERFIKNCSIESDGYPLSYNEEDYWLDINSGCDAGGVHVNSTPMSYCFYLISLGGTHNGISVPAIGVDKAEKIVAHAFLNYARRKDTYHKTRECWILAAEDLYGGCSNEVKSVCKGWSAIQVGPSDCPCVNYYSSYDTTMCWSSWRGQLATEAAPLSINQSKVIKPSIKVFPNPVDNILNIDISNLSEADKQEIQYFEIVDITGRTLEKVACSDSKRDDIIAINTVNLIAGLYFLTVKDQKNEFNYRFIKI